MPKPIITIPKEAQGRLKMSEAQLEATQRNEEGERLIKWAAHQQMRKMMFGDRMEPTFKQRCLQYSSFDTIKRAQAAYRFLDRLNARAGN